VGLVVIRGRRVSAREPRAAASAPAAWRPRFHVTGERNWINDPNGPIHHAGVHHLFYQANPGSPFWGAPHWGHVTSTDLVRWTRRPIALAPGPGGPDADGCWSGCARLVDGRPAVYYTGVVGTDDARVESVCRAWGSHDLLTLAKDPANPLIGGPPPELRGVSHRDPFLWRDGRGWHLLVGSGTREGERHGRVLVYDSDDATAWRSAGVFFAAPRRCAGLDLGEHWECPQLLLGDGSDAALIVSAQVPGAEWPLMYAVAFAGRLDRGRFDGRLLGRLDHGDVFYAPALAPDATGRTLLWGWAQERLQPDRHAALSHAGALTLPRTVALAGGRVTMRPVPELEALRVAPLEPAGAHGDLVATPQMELCATLPGDRAAASWVLTGADGTERTVVRLDGEARRMTVTAADGAGASRTLDAPLDGRAEHRMRVFVDGSLIEVFADGDVALTTRSYPATGAWARVGLTASAGGGLPAAAWRLRDDVVGGADVT
jgi:beta-fructofuranosidase